MRVTQTVVCSRAHHPDRLELAVDWRDAMGGEVLTDWVDVVPFSTGA